MNKVKGLIIFTLVGVFLVMASGVQAQVMFGVKPATMVQSSYFGFLAGTSMVLQFGLDYARIKVTVEGETLVWDPDVGDWVTQSVENDYAGSMMMPHGGLKMYLKPRGAGLTSPYFMADLFKAFTSVDLEVEGVDTEEMEEFIQDLLSPWGLYLAFGAEYHFSDTFSLGGEYGFRYLMSKGEREEADLKVSTNLGATYAAITANFAF